MGTYRHTLRPCWQISLIGTLGMALFGGLGILLAWADYVFEQPQGLGALLTLLLLPTTLTGLLTTIATLQGNTELTIEQSGFSIPRHIFDRVFYTWEEIQRFELKYIKHNQFASFQTQSGKTVNFNNALPIANSDLVELMRNHQQHFLTGAPLKDLSVYKARPWWRHSTLSYLLLMLPIIALLYSLLINQLASPSSEFIFQNSTPHSITEIIVIGATQNRPTVNHVAPLKPEEERKVKLNGFRSGWIQIQFNDNSKGQSCIAFNRRCTWGSDTFNFLGNKQIEAQPKSRKHCRFDEIIQTQCYRY